MLRVTWEWLGQGPALDLANTVAITEGAELDLIESSDDYQRWAKSEAPFVSESSAQSLERSRKRLIELRAVVREILIELTSGKPAPRGLIQDLNRASRRAPGWLELDTGSLRLNERMSGSATERLVAEYARSAMRLVADEATRLRRCPAPSCGMFYLSTRKGQRWCSVPCGTRARVARHYENRRTR